jgi:hypothetical protein
MARLFGDLFKIVRPVFADHLLPVLLIGVILAAFALGCALDDPHLAYGLLIVGSVTAFLESAAQRKRKP